jgi:hypothetical protein
MALLIAQPASAISVNDQAAAAAGGLDDWRQTVLLSRSRSSIPAQPWQRRAQLHRRPLVQRS